MDIPEKYEAEDTELRWRDAWAGQDLYTWDPTRSREETFVIDTPPPTVSGSLHLGHIFSYSHQDFVARYQRMRGKNIFFPIGWDDNGLPTERRVQNLLNVRCEPGVPYDPNLKVERVDGKPKDPPRAISRKNFVELCDIVVKDDEKIFKSLWTRMGMSYDWAQEYATINAHCRRISQLSFLDLLEKNEVYQDERPVLWDVDFKTAVAQAELTDKERPSAYHHLNFRVDGTDTNLVVATTRPELLPACVAVVVHPDDERYRAYVGKRAVTPLFHVPVPIYADTKADPEKGTGVVMVCTFGDQTDVEWWTQFKLPLRQVLDRAGCLRPVTFGQPGWESTKPTDANAIYAQLQGKYSKQAQKTIVEIAEATPGVIAAPKKDIVHAVKFFEKGDRPLELIPARQWYTRLLDKKDALIEQGRKIGWHPDYMRKRYEHWVEGLNQDWCLSRQRYFGVPIPVWYAIDANGETLYDQRIVPTREQLPVDPLADAPAGFREDQRGKPNGFTGDPDVFDTWATSSLTPQIASGWVDDPERHKKLFPMDIRPQAHEIIRTWAFYTIVKAYLHEREIPWKNIILSGWILDPERKKMSKSQGNVVTPEPLITQFGADAVRYWAGRARLGVDTALDEQVFKVGKRLCTKLFNASKFVIERFTGLDPAALTPDQITCESDRAAIAQLRPLIRRAADAFDEFDYAQALQLTEEFFWATFCDNYIELAKPRTYDEGLTEGKLSAAATLRLLHRALVRMFAPFLPFLAEEIWHWAYAADPDMHASVHRSPWPTLDEFAAIPEPKSPRTWPLTLLVAEAVRKAKADANLSIKAPVKRVVVVCNPQDAAALDHAVLDITRMLSINVLDLNETEGTAEPTATVELA